MADLLEPIGEPAVSKIGRPELGLTDV